MSKITNDQHQPPKRVKVTLACVLCRKKKVKCDGVQPTCSRCQSIGNCCQYSEPPKKRGPPKGYVEVIENRAHRIETLLVNQQHHNHQQTIYDLNKSNNSNSFVHISADDNKKSNALQSNLNQPVNALIGLIAGAVDAVSETASDNIVHGSHGIIYDFLMTPNVLISNEQEDKHICNIINDDSLSLKWVENFFNHFNFIFPILSRPQFTFQLERNELNPLLKLAVFTLGCKLENNNQNEEKLLFNQFMVSHDLILVPDLSTVQATLIMCWYTYITGDINKCNSFRLQLRQLINDSNLGYESDNTNIHFTEMKRRAFWVSFVIDQWLASCTDGKRMLISPNNQPWDCKWPQLEDNQLYALRYQQQQQQQPNFINDSSYFSIESALQINSFNEMIRLSLIVADMCSGVNLNNLEANLTEWLLHLPSYLDYGKPTSESNAEPSPIAKLYRILYYTVQIMLNNNNKNNVNGITTSICTTAANTIIHISEQMVERDQQRYLYNVFLLSLTLATSIHLDNTLEKVENASDRISLYKSVTLIKNVNCTLIPSARFEQLIDHFLTDRCRILLDDTIAYPSPSNSSTLLPRKNSNKRMLPDDEEDYQSTLAMNSPSSLYSSLTDIQESISIINYPKSIISDNTQEEFDLNEILFPNMMDPLSTEGLQCTQQWPEWIFDNQPSIESSTTTCSPASYITPSQSPSLSLCQKEEEENNLSFELLSNQHFLNSFPLL